MIPNFIEKSRIPHKSGVYIFKNKSGQTIYVGKALDLYHRVSSYFSASQSSTLRLRPEGASPGSVKTAALVTNIASVETVIVESELEALILEANLIKKYLPQFNVRLTDDKDYLYIKITKEDFPKIITARKYELKGSLKYFGPFPSSTTVKNTLKQLRKVFPWCSSPLKRLLRRSTPRNDTSTSLSAGVIANEVKQSRPCFYYHLGQCNGACVGKITREDYRKNIFRLSQLLEGNKKRLVEDLTKEMTHASKKQDFEEAGKIKKMISGINYLTQINRTQFYLENPNFLEEETNLALKQLQKDLELKVVPGRIEGYDISNLQGKKATGSMVVLTNGEIDKSQYRRFKISPPAGGSGKPNDVGMMREMIGRRLNHPEWPTPDLILVDGGRGQVRAVEFEIRNLSRRRRFEKQLEIHVYGLAKRMEWLYPPEGKIIKLPRKSPSLKLLQKLRDEAHRFAISYHRKLRDKI